MGPRFLKGIKMLEPARTNTCLPFDYAQPYSKKPRKYFIDEVAHRKIEKVYKTDTGSGQVKTLADSLKLPRWKVSRYAQRQGWLAKQKKEPNWTEKEIKILERASRYVPEIIQRKLKAQGFERSLTGIVLKRKRMRFLSNLPGQSANSVAMCLGVDPKFITKAIKQGRLKAKKRGTARHEGNGGDMYYIVDKHLKNYVVEYINEIDIRKVDKLWFVDLLTGRIE